MAACIIAKGRVADRSIAVVKAQPFKIGGRVGQGAWHKWAFGAVLFRHATDAVNADT